MRMLIAGGTALVLASLFNAQGGAGVVSCESLASMTLPKTTITRAELVPAGKFTLPEAPATLASSLGVLPAFCRVAATLKPSADSDIKIEIWLPALRWNGKFQAVGNGGWAGSISYGPMAGALQRGYATASTDTGHSTSGGSFALGHPEKLVDFGYRAVHEMTVQAKAIIAAFYGSAPRLAYFTGCSSGGRQGLREAQQFPADYDGIVSGAPTLDWAGFIIGDMWTSYATLKDPASYIPKDKYPLIHKVVLEQCDALDGVKDGVLEDPTRCRFDPRTLQCAGADGPACLTAAQVEAAKKIYAGPRNPRTGKQIHPGLEPGSELAWANLAGGPEPFGVAADLFKYVVFKNPAWDFRTMNFDTDVQLAEKVDNGLMSAANPDVKQYAARGGKLLIYHGWNDQLVPPRRTVEYYTAVAARLGGYKKASDAVRLFMAPGMTHCSGGEGPSTFDALTAIERWVEQTQAPDQIIASHMTNGVADRTRPLCPYPQTAYYNGTGSTDDAASFTCKIP